MARHTLTYDGTDLKTYGIYVSGEDSWAKPAPDITRTTVPGRSGDLITFNNRYENVDIVYHLGIVADFNENFSNFIGFLLKSPGYKKLVDSYHPDVYRMAMVESSIAPEMTVRNREGLFDVAFNCKPQTYLISGDTATTFTSSGTITNPTPFKAKPLLRVYGTGSLSVGGRTISISTNSSYTDIDCDLQDAFRGSTNCNGNITLQSGDFPELSAGSNTITLGSGITRVVITPRWWRL